MFLLHACMCAMREPCPQKPEKCVRIAGIVITDLWAAKWVLGTEPGYFSKAANVQFFATCPLRIYPKSLWDFSLPLAYVLLPASNVSLFFVCPLCRGIIFSLSLRLPLLVTQYIFYRPMLYYGFVWSTANKSLILRL